MTAPDINNVRPTSLAHLIGQQSVKDQVAVALDAAFADNRRFDSALLVGPPGLGKSALAGVIAAEMATELHEVLGQSISCPADLNALLLQAKESEVVHIDEAHELDKEYQTALYLAMDRRTLVVSSGSGRSPSSIKINDFTLLLSTTDEYCLLQPLRDRMRLTLRFQHYSADELTDVVRHRARALAWELAEGVPTLIAVRSRGTPRWALRLLQSCRRVCRSEGEQSITLQHLQRACQLEQLDELGLGPSEQEYLYVIAEGPTRLNVVASRLGLPTRTVSQVTEPFLIRAGLITKDNSGRRQLTAAGYEQVSKSSRSTA